MMIDEFNERRFKEVVDFFKEVGVFCVNARTDQICLIILVRQKLETF